MSAYTVRIEDILLRDNTLLDLNHKITLDGKHRIFSHPWVQQSIADWNKTLGPNKRHFLAPTTQSTDKLGLTKRINQTSNLVCLPMNWD